MLGLVLSVIIVLALGVGLYVRLAPSNPAVWQVDPARVTAPKDKGHFLVRPEGGDAPGQNYALRPEALLTAFDRIVLASPRTRVLAGSVAEGTITYITRSALWGFPDYTTVSAVPVADGARLVIFARQRFGSKDLGVNKARVLGWLAELDAGAAAR